MIHIKKGLDLPITGTPKQSIEDAVKVKTVAITGSDYVGMKPSMKVKVGDEVKTGQVLFECKKNLGLSFTAPAAGKVIEINRGAKRVFESLVIEISGDEAVTFNSYNSKAVADLSKEDVKSLMIESGLWTGLRTRPFSKVADVTGTPNAIFITASDTNPLAACPSHALNANMDDFKDGVEILSKLTDGKTYVCKMEGLALKTPSRDVCEVKEFKGKHPAGNVGTHIHFVSPVSANKVAWHMGYQDVIAVGKLFKTGKLFTERLVALGGPAAKNPRILRTQVGANISEITNGEVNDGETRVISGSILNGRRVEGAYKYLGHYHNQISVLEEGNVREFLGWHAPGYDKYSNMRTFVANFLPPQLFNLTTDRNGSYRAVVPVGAYEKVMPLDVLPSHLIKAIIVGDTDNAQKLGALELDEEDLALCTFVDPGKHDLGSFLRKNLTTIEKEG